jgi:hypothetical protein
VIVLRPTLEQSNKKRRMPVHIFQDIEIVEQLMMDIDPAMKPPASNAVNLVPGMIR